MQKSKSNYERVILVLMALAAMGAAGWVIFTSGGLQATLQPKPYKEKHETEPPPMAKLEDTMKRAVTAPKPWTAPERSNKPVPLNKSVLLVLKEDQIFDLAVETPMLRPPMTNEYIRTHELQYLMPNVADLDPDGDGYNNLEEFNAKTNPKDARSMPAITDKLFMVERISNDYRIMLRSGSPPYQIQTMDEPKKKNWFVDPNGVDSTGAPQSRGFGGLTGERFRALSFTSKKVPDPRLGELDVSELEIEEFVTKQKHVLVMKKELNLAVYQAKLEFRLRQPAVALPLVKEGDNFRIPGFEDTTYKVMKINPDSVIISPVKADGAADDTKQILIKKA